MGRLLAQSGVLLLRIEMSGIGAKRTLRSSAAHPKKSSRRADPPWAPQKDQRIGRSLCEMAHKNTKHCSGMMEARTCARCPAKGGLSCPANYPLHLLEPISKLSEQDNEAGELDKAEEVLSVEFPADEYAALPLYPGKETLDEPASHIAA